MLLNCAKETYPIDAFDYIVDMAEKGFILYCYAVKELHSGIRRNFDYHEYVNQTEFSFLGFIIIEQIRSEDNIEAIKDLRRADVNLLYISEQREL